MSVVVWDGISLAVDRAATDGVTKWELDKVTVLLDGALLTGVGDHGALSALRNWFLGGEDPEDYPRTLQRAELILVTYKGLFRYESASPHPIEHRHNKCAFGSGKDFAYGALAMGATSEQAATVACNFSTSCGHGVQVFTVGPNA